MQIQYSIHIKVANAAVLLIWLYPSQWSVQDAYTADNEDTLQASSETRSSSEDDVNDDNTGPKPVVVYDDNNDDQTSQINISSPLKLHPSSDDDGEEAINFTFPKKSVKKASFESEFRVLTKENTKSHVRLSLRSSDVRMLYR